MNNEEWRDIKGFEGLYVVSTLGRVFSIKRKIFLSNSYKNDYHSVSLVKDGKIYYRKVHRLVAETFIPNPNNLPFVNHKDENKNNNNVDNLEWCDCKYNNLYSIKLGKKKIVAVDLEGEVWKNIINEYYVSSYGRFKSKDRLLRPQIRKNKNFYKLNHRYKRADIIVYNIFHNTNVKTIIHRDDNTLNDKLDNLDIPTVKSLKNEIWKTFLVKDNNEYQVSNFGRVKNKYKILTLQKDFDGYISVKILGKSYKVHRLIAQLFIPNPNNLPIVNHKDGNKSNYNINNLEWVDISKNTLHSCYILKNKIKRVYCEELKTEYENAIVAAQEVYSNTDIKKSSYLIRRCCRGEQKSYKKLHWKYI